ncbi:ABC transporter ATP-binding protein [Achromobacter marplatensis]|uniref:Capsular polysaccharide transport system ATP-binding protein n=1 Tax=Achromobacter marplatensis TaxID=470868 RepID=A0ABX9GM55_9BURK|nr:ABC transporter ATP-binding protein [Achromobacter marplatensis]OWT72310.1 ABC transporter ATP-binding protein [Achromobacter marplatensis]RBP24403.1 capsular polysaccharide transport system ATP-binding protein [Achromobacter marplatensis]CAB3626829.1 Polysialic acid transport ATP-binding protein KpsT [Achromobacter marplatensis]
MIRFVNIQKTYISAAGRYTVFKDLSFEIPSNRNVALIGRNGSGKSTLLRLIAGLDKPDRGSIVTSSRISWPIGLSGGFQGSLTGQDNVKFVARVMGAGGDQMRKIVDYVRDFAEIGEHFDLPVKTYSSGMRSRVAFGLSLAFDFDYYLVDEAMSVGDAHFREKAAAAFKERVLKSRLLLVTHGMGQVRKMCDMVFFMKNGNIEIYEDVEEGIRRYESDGRSN